MKLTARFSQRALLAAFVALATPACGGAVMSGVAIGKVGHGLSESARLVPQAAEVCGFQEAMTSTGSTTDKPASEACAKSAKNDRVWRGALMALSAYGDALETMSSGKSDGAGRAEAAASGIHGKDWVDADGAAEQAARDAAAALMAQLEQGRSDPEQTIKDAAPHVKTLCDGLTSYLDTQTKAFADLSKDAEKKRATRGDRRCTQLDSRTICVAESVIDRMVYGKVYAQAMLLEGAHAQARDNVGAFCAAHRKAEEAGLGSGKYGEIVDALKAGRKKK